MKNKVVIVGAGISARIAKFFYPESIMIAPSITNNPFFYLWQTKDTLRFVKQFKLSFTKKIIKSMRIGSNVEKYNVLTYKPRDNKPSKGLTEIKTLVINDKRLINANIDYINTIVSIDTDSHTILLDNNKVLSFKKLIWTAPINFRLNNKIYRAKYSPISFIRCYSEKELFSEDYCYTFLDSFLDAGIYRISRKEDYYTFEIARSYNNLERAKSFIRIVFPEIICGNIYTYTTGHIVTKINVPKCDDILYLGRNAQMERKIMAHDVVSKLYEVTSK